MTLLIYLLLARLHLERMYHHDALSALTMCACLQHFGREPPRPPCSSALLHLQQKQRRLVRAKRFSQAGAVAHELKRLQQELLQRAQEQWKHAQQVALAKLAKRHEQERAVLQQKQDLGQCKVLRQHKAASDAQLRKRQTDMVKLRRGAAKGQVQPACVLAVACLMAQRAGVSSCNVH